MTVSSIAYAFFAIYAIVGVLVSIILNIVFLPFTLISGSPILPSGVTQISDFIQGVFTGQLVAGSLFTNFMLITVLGFISMKLFISFSLYETKLVPTR
jgi:hypothetical protein